MQIKTLKKNHLKRNLVIGVVAVTLLTVGVLNYTKAKYRVTESIPLVNGTINYTESDLNLVGVYLQTDNGYTKSDTIPDSGYELNTEQSYCEVNGEEDTSITINYDTSTQALSITPMTSKGTKCYLYFDEAEVLLKDAILADKTISNSRSGAITGTLTTNTTGTVYSVEDDYGTSYVYAGAPTDNWVYFAGFYWRIIRINGDGSIRMIYNGTSTTTTGTSTQITVDGSNTFLYNPTYGDNTYVGYMTGLQNECASTTSCSGSSKTTSYSQSTNNSNDSTIKTVLDTWYEENIFDTEYEQYISTEQGFCNDRSLNTTSETWVSWDTKRGYGTNVTAYGPYGRIFLNDSWRSSQTPSLKCSQTNDYFTVDESSKGNHALEYSIGLITADEVVLAGGFGGNSNSSYYLYTNQNYWTMSPYAFYTYGHAFVFTMYSTGVLSGSSVSNAYGVRPVLNLDSNVTISFGDGTSSNPYTIAT